MIEWKKEWFFDWLMHLRPCCRFLISLRTSSSNRPERGTVFLANFGSTLQVALCSGSQLWACRENPANFAAGGHLATLAQLLHVAPLVVRIHAASALSMAVAVAWDSPALTLPAVLQTSSQPQQNKKPAAENPAVLSPRKVGIPKRGKKGPAESLLSQGPRMKALAAEGGAKLEGGSLIEGLLRLAEITVEGVHEELAGADAPSTLAFLRRQFGPVSFFGFVSVDSAG